MFGLTKEAGACVFTLPVEADTVKLCLFRTDGSVEKLPFEPCMRRGAVWQLRVREALDDCRYAFEIDGVMAEDRYARKVEPCAYGECRGLLRAVVPGNGKGGAAARRFRSAWAEDRGPGLEYADMLIYRLHPRGFTRHSSSGLAPSRRGTLAGLSARLPYLLELGVNCIELMPSYQFAERTGPDRLNYWGFCETAQPWAVKPSYCARPEAAEQEMKSLVLECHQRGIAVVLDFYFGHVWSTAEIVELLRYWRAEYHIDGAHLIGPAPLEALASDPYLADMLLWGEDWQGLEGAIPGVRRAVSGVGQAMPGVRRAVSGIGREQSPRLAEYNSGFQNELRRLLKSDEGALGALPLRLREGGERACIHYMANVDGFSLMDVFSYDRKHNEENGEHNRDGTDQNYSWNCGEEGPSRKKPVQRLREQLWRSALLLLFVSQGTPLLCQGDELGQSRGGNNNAYGLDDERNWLDWRLLKRQPERCAYVRALSSLRRAHAVFRQKRSLSGSDYRNLGQPDVSFHGLQAWQPGYESYRRELGMLLCGAYAGDSSFLLLCNFHWEAHEFQLPHPPAGQSWCQLLRTDSPRIGAETEQPEAGVLIRPEAGALVRSEAGVLVRPEAGALARSEAGALARSEAGALMQAEAETLIQLGAEQSVVPLSCSGQPQTGRDVHKNKKIRGAQDMLPRTSLVPARCLMLFEAEPLPCPKASKTRRRR